jgi:predicted RecB family endonuclease
VQLLGAEPKPVPSIDILTSAQASARYNIEVESWGTKGWDAVRAICVWAKARGMSDAPC